MIVSHSKSNEEAFVGQRRGGPAKIHDQTFANQKLKYKVSLHSVYGLFEFQNVFLRCSFAEYHRILLVNDRF